MANTVAAALTRALGPRVTPAGEVGAPPAGAPAVGAPAVGEPSVSPVGSLGARIVGLVLLALALALALLVDGEDSAFQPEEEFVLLAGFYVAAQAVERLFEFVLPPGQGSAQAKADRVFVVGGLATLLGVILSLALGLYFLEAIQVQDPNRELDVFVTGLVIGAGTKPLHDLITRIEKKKEAP